MGSVRFVSESRGCVKAISRVRGYRWLLEATLIEREGGVLVPERREFRVGKVGRHC